MIVPSRKILVATVTLVTFFLTEPLFAQNISLIDLATGDASIALGINDAGQVVGQNGSIFGLHAFRITPEDSDLDGTLDLWVRDDNNDGFNDLPLDLGTIVNTRSMSQALAINDLGHVVGYSTYIFNENPHTAFIWTESGGMVNLGTVGPPFVYTRAYGINNLGQVVGKYDGGIYEAFIVNPDDTNLDGAPDTWFRADSVGRNALMYGLGTLGGPRSGAHDIDDFGHVVGWSMDAGGFYRAFIIQPLDENSDGMPETWFIAGSVPRHNSLMIDLGTLGGRESIAHGVNNTGQVVGESETATGNFHAFLITPEFDASGVRPIRWNRDDDGDGRNDLMVDLGTTGVVSRAYAINDLGQIVGSLGPWESENACLWTQDLELLDLGATAGISSSAFSINQFGQVAGYVTYDSLAGRQAALWAIELEQGGGGSTDLTIDIMPGSCRNPINGKSQGKISVAVLGREDFDVTQVDPASIRLMGEAPLRWSFEDVTSPLAGDVGTPSCGEVPDGITDLILKFDTQSVIGGSEAYYGRSLEVGDEFVMVLTGTLLPDFLGELISGEDVVHIKSRERGNTNAVRKNEKK